MCVKARAHLFFQGLLHNELLGVCYALYFDPQEHASRWGVPLCEVCTHMKEKSENGLSDSYPKSCFCIPVVVL